MKLGAIDIGSNAVRLQITNVIESKNGPIFKKLEYVRFPMRLGHEVFLNGKLSDRQEARFVKLMKAFKILIDLYELTDYRGCATSAMREASNGQSILNRVKKETGLEVELIDGEVEASMINDAIVGYLDDQLYLHIDVGGGSTELNVYKNSQIVKSASFKIGSVRRLTNKDTPETWEELKTWIMTHIPKREKIIAVGTGGNVNKFFELAKIKSGKQMPLRKFKELQQNIREMSLEQKLVELQLNPDRADVIIPASEIYIQIMEWAKCRSVLVPNVGLKDGIMKFLYERNAHKV